MDKSSKKKKPNIPFKSPFQTTAGSHREDAHSVENVNELQDKISKLDKEIDELHSQGYKEEELQVHIDKLHEYNELKDIGQEVLGRLATIQGVQTKDLYSSYSLQLND